MILPLAAAGKLGCLLLVPGLGQVDVMEPAAYLKEYGMIHPTIEYDEMGQVISVRDGSRLARRAWKEGEVLQWA